MARRLTLAEREVENVYHAKLKNKFRQAPNAGIEWKKIPIEIDIKQQQ